MSEIIQVKSTTENTTETGCWRDKSIIFWLTKHDIIIRNWNRQRSLNMYLLRVSRSKQRSQKHTSKDKRFSSQMNTGRLGVWGKRKITNNMKDSFTNHFILRSIKTTEHEIMQILLSGRVGIDQTHLDGFVSVLMCVCVFVCVKAKKERKCVHAPVSSSVWAHLCVWPLIKGRAPVCRCGEEPIDQK